MLADARISSLGHLWFDTGLFKDQAYKSIVRPTLECGCTVWDPYRANQKSWLEQVQRRAERFVTRTCTKEEGCVTKALKQLNWPTLEKWRQVAGLTLMYKFVTNQAAIDIPCYVQHQSSLKTRAPHPLKFIPLQPSCDTYKYSFWPRTIIDWNSLPSDYLTMDSTAKVKATISDFIFSGWCLPLSIYCIFIFIFPSRSTLVRSWRMCKMIYVNVCKVECVIVKCKPVETHPWPIRNVRRIVEVTSTRSRRLNQWYLKYLLSATRCHILTTAKIYQLNTYNKVNLFHRRVPVIATIFWETQRLNTPQTRIFPYDISSSRYLLFNTRA